MTRGAGLRIRSGSKREFSHAVERPRPPPSIAATLALLRNLIAVLNEELTQADATFATLVADDPIVAP